VIKIYLDDLIGAVEEDLASHPDFVRIAGKWFARALLVDINAGHLNLAEAILDMAGGGPLATPELLKQIGIPADTNPKLVEFSIDLALQEDPRFDEVGASGDVVWYLQRLEPAEVLTSPPCLRQHEIPYDRSILTPEMLALELALDDELSPSVGKYTHLDEGEVRLIYPHWRSGTLPLSIRIRHLFPTAYEAPRVRFTLVDGDTNERFQGWVVREKGYIFGLKDWYTARGVIPGSILRVRRGQTPGDVIVQTDGRRSAASDPHRVGQFDGDVLQC
jgi:hypothetical protein